MSFLPPSSLLDSAYSRVARPHACTAHVTEMLRPATAMVTAGGFVFTPVYAPLVAEDDAASSSDGAAQSLSAMSLAQHALHSTPYGVAIHMHPATSSASQLGGNDALASVVAAGGEFDPTNLANSEQLLEPPFLVGGHEQPVQAIAAVEIRSERQQRNGGRNQYEDEEQCEAENDDVAADAEDADCVSDVLLVTCSLDRLVIWHLSEILSCLSSSPPIQPTGRVLPLSYEVHRMHIDESGSKLALCLASTGVVVVDLESGTVDAVLEGHAGRVNGAPFLPSSYLPADAAASAGSIVVTYGQDRTFKLWNLSARRLLYTSAIVSASPFVQHCWDPPGPAASAASAAAASSSMARFILGSEDGKLRHYDLSKLLPHIVAALAPSPSAASTIPSASSAVPLQGTIVRLIHTLDVAVLQLKLFRAHARSAEEARRKAAAIQAQGKVIRANNAEPSYKPFMATEANMPGGGLEDGTADDGAAATAAEGGDAPPSILALFYPTHINLRVGAEGEAASWVPPTAPVTAAAAAAAAPAPRRSPSASPSGSPSASPTASPSASPSALSLSATADTLYAVTSKGVSRINTRTYEVEWTASFLGDDASAASSESASPIVNLSVLSVGLASLACFLECAEMDALASEFELYLALASPFLGRLSLLKISVPLAAGGGGGAERAAGMMQRPSIFPQGPLPKQSALRQWAWPADAPASAATAAAKKKQQLALAAAAARKGLKPGQVGAPTSHNLVFHTRIKSSGYGPPAASASAAARGPRALNLGGLHQKANSTAGRAFLTGQKKAAATGAGAASPAAAAAAASYPLTCGPINVYSPHNAPSKSPPLHNGPIVSLSFSSDAKRLLSASLDSTASSVRVPPWKHPQGTAHLIGHKKPLRCASWAWINPSAPQADNADVLALTSSADGTARMWALGRADPILVFDRSKRNEPVTASSLAAGSAAASSSAAAAAAAGSADNPLFTSDIVACSFYRQNQLVLLLHRSALLLFKYHLDPFKTNVDLKKLQNRNKYRRLSLWESSAGAQSITALGCVNSFLSTLVVVGDSLRGLSLVDLATNQTCREIKEAHAKPVHAIIMNAPSSGAQMGEEAMESAQLFLSLSTDSAIKLWDVRSAECARKFTGHVCRSAPVRASFSPCGRYIASGSEDGRAYVFDIRNGNVVDKLSGATDVVSDVAYHPVHPQVVTSCYDGRIRFYSSA